MFYGGAAGGGKSDFLLGDFLQDVEVYGPAWRGILFRRTYPELQELIERSHELYAVTGAEWNVAGKIWRWPNGAMLRFAYLESDTDKFRYQGHQYTWIGWDELTQWANDKAYRYLRSRLRSAQFVPYKRIRATANPGGAGHHWVKDYFVAWAPGGYTIKRDPETGHRLLFIPAKLTDNRLLEAADPGYANRLKGVGSAAYVASLLHGSWDVVDGAFFDCWSNRLVLRPSSLPEQWIRFRSADWGSASPFAVHWWAVVNDDWRHPDGQKLPRGSIVCYREWYGSENPAASGSSGLKMTAEQVGQGIVRLERHDPKLSYGVIDPSAFKEDGGPSIGERVNNELIAKQLAAFHDADNTRIAKVGAIGGWDQLRARIIGQEDTPAIYFFSTSVAAIRTIPSLQHDPENVEDLDTNSEDHAADSVRYACMSRPYLRKAPEKEEPKDGYRDLQEEELLSSDSFMAI